MVMGHRWAQARWPAGSGLGLRSATGQKLKAFCVQFFKNLLTVLVLGGFVQSLSRVRLFVTPWTVARQAPLSTGFSRQECWSGVPFPSPGDLPDPGIKPESPTLQAGSLPSDPLGWIKCR